MDDGVKKVVDALRAKRELDNTLIIYTSDNGYFHGEHRIPQGKTRVYEESIRVPLEMRGPGIPQGVSVNPLVINADLAPTIVDAADAKPGLAMDGRSLLPVAQHPGDRREPGAPDRGAVRKAIRTRATCTPSTRHGSGSSTTWSDPFELQSLDR